MENQKTTLIVAIFIASMLVIPTVMAQERVTDEEKRIAGITPDNLLYGLDKAIDNIIYLISAEDSAIGLRIARERLAESIIMRKQKKKAFEIEAIEEFKKWNKRVRERSCIQVITPAKNRLTGECRNFPTPCDVIDGWEIVNNCEEKQIIENPVIPTKKIKEGWDTLNREIDRYVDLPIIIIPGEPFRNKSIEEKKKEKESFSCTDEWNPVCGEDGETYGNSCQISIKGIEINCEGMCPCENRIIEYENPIIINGDYNKIRIDRGAYVIANT